ncbi:MAG: ATP-binding cassette domain-containing protein [Gemmatimonadaceae bacterium]
MPAAGARSGESLHDQQHAAERWPRGIRRALQFVGRRGAALIGVCVALALLLAGAEYALAFILILLLYSLHLVGPSALPAWLAPAASAVPARTVWMALVLVGLVRALATAANFAARGLLAENTHARMQMALAYRVLMMREANAMPLSEMSLYTGEVFPKATEYLLRVTQAAAALIQAAIVGIGTFVLAPWPAAVALAGVAGSGWAMHRLNRVTNRVGSRVQDARADLERTKVRIARNRFVIRIFGLEQTEYAAWLRTSFSYFRNNSLAYVSGHLAGALMPALGLAMVAGIVMANGRYFHTPAVSLVAFFYLFYRTQQLLTQASMHIGGLAWYQPQAASAMELVLSLPPQERRAAMLPESAFRITRRSLELPWATHPQGAALAGSGQTPAPAIALHGVSFAWDGTDTPVLSNLSLDVPPGTQLAIVGPNGSGKSTLLGLILGALRPSIGQVRINGQPAELWVRAHPQAIAYVGPEPYLIHGSVLENLVYGAGRNCSQAEIWAALATVGLDDLFRALPGGLDHALQEDGAGLSSGQKQRIAIARGFLRRPSLFVMDEPSANLDADSEARILDALASVQHHCTVVLVSHRAAMLRDATRVIQLQDPRVEAIA